MCSLGAAACYLLFMLTRATLMPSLFHRLQGDPLLGGVSHIIIDEVHEVSTWHFRERSLDSATNSAVLPLLKSCRLLGNAKTPCCIASVALYRVTGTAIRIPEQARPL